MSDIYNIYKNPYEFVDDSYTGLGGFRYDWKYSYLIPFPTEMTEMFDDRKVNAVLENIYQPLQDLFLDPIKTAGYNIDFKSANNNLQYIYTQSQVIKVCNEIITGLKLNDLCVFGTSTNVNEEDGVIETGDIPEIENIPIKNIEQIIMNGLKVKSALYFEYENYKNVRIPVEVFYANNVFTKTTKAWIKKDGSITLKEQKDSTRLTEFDDIRYGVLNKIGEEFGKIPSSFSLANQQKLLFNMDSQRLSTLRKFDFPLLMIQTDKDIAELSLSGNTMLKVGLDAKFPELLEADLNGVEITSEIIEEKKAFIYKTFTKDLLTSNVKYTSAVSSIIAQKSFTSTVELFYEIYKVILLTIMNDVKFIYNIENDLETAFEFPEIDENINEEIKEKANVLSGEI